MKAMVGLCYNHPAHLEGTALLESKRSTDGWAGKKPLLLCPFVFPAQLEAQKAKNSPCGRSIRARRWW